MYDCNNGLRCYKACQHYIITIIVSVIFLKCGYYWRSFLSCLLCLSLSTTRLLVCSMCSVHGSTKRCAHILYHTWLLRNKLDKYFEVTGIANIYEIFDKKLPTNVHQSFILNFERSTKTVVTLPDINREGMLLV